MRRPINELMHAGRRSVADALRVLMAECWLNAEDKGFHENDEGFSSDIALAHSELSEALEDYRNGHAFDEIWFEKKEYGNKPCGIASEYADVIIRVLERAQARGIPVIEALELKLAFNRLRPRLHGGKKI